MLKKVAIGLILMILLLLPLANPAWAEEPEEGYELLWSHETGDQVLDVSVSADGSFIAAGSNDHRVYFFVSLSALRSVLGEVSGLITQEKARGFDFARAEELLAQTEETLESSVLAAVEARFEVVPQDIEAGVKAVEGLRQLEIVLKRASVSKDLIEFRDFLTVIG